MESPLDIAVVLALLLGAVGFLIWRFGGARPPPSCAPESKGKPQVLLGARLAKGLKSAKRERQVRQKPRS